MASELSNRASHRGSMRRIQDVNAGNQRRARSLSNPPKSPRSSSSAGSMRRAVREIIHTVADRRSKRSIYDPRGYVPVVLSPSSPPRNNSTRKPATETFVEVDEEMMSIFAGHNRASVSLSGYHKTDYGSTENGMETSNGNETEKVDSSSSSLPALILQQATAVIVVALLNMMMAIPFGASYFPVGWKDAKCF